jgi:hypothetical protein
VKREQNRLVRLISEVETNSKGELIMKATFVLLIEHDNADWHASVHPTLNQAETALHDWAADFFQDMGEECPKDNALVRKLAQNNEYPRIFQCNGRSGGIALTSLISTRRTNNHD